MATADRRACLLLNPRAGTAARLADVRARLEADGVVIHELADGDDLAARARAAADDGFDPVIVAGGDGTVQAAARGLLGAKRKATLAVVPLGTGNDFCRTLAVPLDPAAAADLLRTGTPRDVDAARIDGGPGGFLVNAATGGFSGKVAAGVSSELKAALGPLAYVAGAVGPVADPPTYHVTIRFDDGPPERFDVLNVVVANARTAAGGFPVAPSADPEDGQLDVVLVRAADTLDLTIVTARLMHGDYTHDENVTHRRAARVELTSDPPLPMSLDGERCECGSVTFTVVPRALRVLAGPDYRRAPDLDHPVEAEDEHAAAPRPDPGVAARGFGFLAGFLLLVKRTPGWAAGGFAVAAVAVVLFLWIARGVVGAEWREWDEGVMTAVHARHTPALTALARGATMLGDAAGVTAAGLAALGLMLWRKHYLTAAAFAVSFFAGLLLEGILKPAIGNLRPEVFPRLVEATGYSFPSGHALRGIGVYGFLAAAAAVRAWQDRRAAWWLAAAALAVVALAVGWSRVYLGVHWPTDVIAGQLAAAALVAACLVGRSYAAVRRTPR